MKRSILVSFAFLLIPVSNALAGYSSLFVFGDSISDSGNNALVLKQVTPLPISGNSFIPTYPYASGHYTNDEVWSQMLAASLGLSANPALAGGTDYAFGGALTGTTPSGGFPPSLEAQVGSFLSQYGPMIPGTALYVVEGGGDNARDALAAIGSTCGGNPACVSRIIQSTATSFAGDIRSIDSELEAAGAKNILDWSVPDIGKTPAVLAAGASASMLGTTIASAMNQALSGAIGMDPNLKLFDDFDLLNEAIADPGAFGLSNATDACAKFLTCDPSEFLFWDGIHPTSATDAIITEAIADPGAFGLSNATDACAQFPTCDPSEFLFWDGIHPTSATDAIITKAIDSLVVPEPSTLALLGTALLGLGFIRRTGISRVRAAPSAAPTVALRQRPDPAGRSGNVFGTKIGGGSSILRAEQISVGLNGYDDAGGFGKLGDARPQWEQ